MRMGDARKTFCLRCHRARLRAYRLFRA